MNLLLDSHTFIWSYDKPHLISQIAITEMSDPKNQLFLSMVSIWEIQIKITIGKLKFQDSFADILVEQQQINGLQILPIMPSHIFGIEKLPSHHKDPFDRLLISQSIIENMMLVSADAQFANYQVNLLW